MKTYISLLFVLIFLTGCPFSINTRVETVVDRTYTPKECPTFTMEMGITGSKYNGDYSDFMVITPMDSLITSLERNKMVRNTFNDSVIESNKPYIVKGQPTTSNYRIVKKTVFIDRECSKYTYTPEITVKKLIPSFKTEPDTTYVVIPLDNLILNLEKHKLAKKRFNKSIDVINGVKK